MAQFSPVKLDQQIDMLKRQTGRRWTIRDIAKETGISPAYLTFLKNGHRRNPSYDIVEKLSRFLQIAPVDLLEQEEQQEIIDVDERVMRQKSFIKQTLEFCQHLLQSNHPEQVLQLLKMLEEPMANLVSNELFIERDLMRANAFMQLGQMPQALELLSNCLERPVSEYMHARILLSSGHVRFLKGEVAHAITDYQEALQYANQAEEGESELLFWVHKALADSNKTICENGKVIYHLENTLRYFPADEAALKKAQIYMELGKVHLHVMSLSSAMQAFLAAESLNREIGDLTLQADLLYLRAKVDMMRQNFASAVQVLKNSLQMRQEQGDHAGVAICLLELAGCCQKMKCWEEANTFARRAEISFENVNEIGYAARAKNIQVEARLHLNDDLNELLELVDKNCDVLRQLGWRYDLAFALSIKAETCRHLGRQETALEVSMQALQMYQFERGS